VNKENNQDKNHKKDNFLSSHIEATLQKLKKQKRRNPMKITVASYKGGVGKTVTAIHLAAALNKNAPTLLIDGDENSSATQWQKLGARAGKGGLPFDVTPLKKSNKAVKKYAHLVIDTKARPDKKSLEILARGCDLLVVPVSPDPLSLHATVLMAQELTELGVKNYKILLTKIPPNSRARTQGSKNLFEVLGAPVFKETIGRYVAFEDASFEGVTVNNVKNRYALRAWKQYYQLSKEILKNGQRKTIRNNTRRSRRAANA